MLSSLYIENIAVIEKAGIEFDSGLNVLTGETGAGKSIVIDAINAVLGERTSKDIVRTGSEKATVTAIFTDISNQCIKKIEDLGYLPDEDGNILIKRVIPAQGNSTCRINGQPITATMVREIGRCLVNIHGQHENQALLSVDSHVDYLESMGDIKKERKQYQEHYESWRSLKNQLEEIETDEGAKARQMDMLKFQIEEIENANLQIDEFDNLTERRELCRNSENVAKSIAQAREYMTGGDYGDEPGALPMLGAALQNLENASKHMNIEELLQRMQSAFYEIEEATNQLRDFDNQLEFQPGELEEIEIRLDILNRIFSKYGKSEQEVLEFLDNATKELEGIEISDKHAKQLEQQIKIEHENVTASAKQLTKARKKAAKIFETQVQSQLSFLDMPGVKLIVSISPTGINATGADLVEFKISANPGEEPKSIAKIASGGELSRIMLAIKSVMSDADDIDTLIFDEIDVGISGRAAQKVGQKLKETAKNRQVLCVTHLAAIAAQADHHFLIEKSVTKGRTFTDVKHLDDEKSIEQIAKIIGGDVTPVALKAAREMMERN